MAVAEILIRKIISLCLVVTLGLGDWSRFQYRPSLKPQGHTRLKVEGVAKIYTLPDDHDSVFPPLGCRLQGRIDGRRVDMPPVSYGTKIPCIINRERVAGHFAF